LRLTLSQPLPLQAFCPAQAFFAAAQKLCPLQLLIPEHRTWTTPALSLALATTPPAMNKSATAVAIERDFAFIFRFRPQRLVNRLEQSLQIARISTSRCGF